MMTFGIVNLKFVTIPVTVSVFYYPDGRAYREFFVFGVRVAAWLV